LPADPDLLFDGPTDAATTIALAHGAGAGMDSPFLDFFARGLGKSRFRVARFEYARTRGAADRSADPARSSESHG
jgi:predicted alpha/beta-hydrolase family hydrolase